MKILKISNINFQAGKIHVFSDFDGTYCPAKHSTLHNPNDNKFMTQYCNKMNTFFQSTNNDVHFHITTGRTLGEYQAITELLKERNFKLPLPESIITKNGSDEFINNTNLLDFYETNKFPFIYGNPNKTKNLEFTKNNNWNGYALKKFIKEIANRYNIKLVEKNSENSVFDYGKESLFHKNNLDPNDWEKLPNENGNIKQHYEPIVDLKIGLRKDGDLKTHIIFPPDFEFCTKRDNIYSHFVNDIKNYLNQNKTKYKMTWEEASSKNFYRKSLNITPEFEGKELTKLYDTKDAVQKALKNKDIVIVAGDSINDFEMLNPLEYIDKDFLKNCESNSSNKIFYQKEMQEKLLDLQNVYSNEKNAYINSLRNELNTNGLLKKIKNLPLYCIIINKENSKLKILSETFKTTNKIINVEAGNIDLGIKEATIRHAKINKNFRKNLSPNIKKLFKISTYSKALKYTVGSLIGLSSTIILYTLTSPINKQKNKQPFYKTI